jgi:hypothetical protein
MRITGKIFSILLMDLILFLIVIVLAEGIFRIVGIPYKVKYIPDENSFARFDPELGWSYIPNKSSIHNTEYTITPVYFEENGIRAPYPDFKFDYSKPSILFIGCSFTMGHGLSYEESFVGKFSALEGMQYQVVNLGVQGYGSDQALLALKKYLSKFNTKIVVYTFIEDHIIRNGNYDRRMLNPNARFLGTKPQFALSRNNEIYLSRKPLFYKDYINSYLFDFIKIRVGSLLGQFPPYPEELTKALIQEMNKYSNEHGAHFVVLNWRWTKKDYNRMFQDLDVNTIDTMEEAPDGWGKMVLLNGIHPDPRASEHTARLLFKYFHTKGIANKDIERLD